MKRWWPRLAVAGGVVVIAVSAWLIGSFAFNIANDSVGAPEIRVDNQSDHSVYLRFETLTYECVPPDTETKFEGSFFIRSGALHIEGCGELPWLEYKACSFDDVEANQPLVITNEGAQCAGILESFPPEATP